MENLTEQEKEILIQVLNRAIQLDKQITENENEFISAYIMHLMGYEIKRK